MTVRECLREIIIEREWETGSVCVIEKDVSIEKGKNRSIEK